MGGKESAQGRRIGSKGGKKGEREGLGGGDRGNKTLVEERKLGVVATGQKLQNPEGSSKHQLPNKALGAKEGQEETDLEQGGKKKKKSAKERISRTGVYPTAKKK